MKLQLVRSATLRLTYAGHLLIIDPYLAPKHSLPSYTGKSPNPLVDLPFPIEQVLAGIEMAVISHLHSDHFDSVAYERVPKDIPIFCQPGDRLRFVERDFDHPHTGESWHRPHSRDHGAGLRLCVQGGGRANALLDGRHHLV